jgi:hypothetical protein
VCTLQSERHFDGVPFRMTACTRNELHNYFVAVAFTPEPSLSACWIALATVECAWHARVVRQVCTAQSEAVQAASVHTAFTQVLFCSLVSDQLELYRAYLASNDVTEILGGSRQARCMYGSSLVASIGCQSPLAACPCPCCANIVVC